MRVRPTRIRWNIWELILVYPSPMSRLARAHLLPLLVIGTVCVQACGGAPVAREPVPRPRRSMWVRRALNCLQRRARFVRRDLSALRKPCSDSISWSVRPEARSAAAPRGRCCATTRCPNGAPLLVYRPRRSKEGLCVDEEADSLAPHVGISRTSSLVRTVYFWAVLYPDTRIRRILEESFVLHLELSNT